MNIIPRWNASLTEDYKVFAVALGLTPKENGLFPIWRLTLEMDGVALGIAAMEEETPTEYRIIEIGVLKEVRNQKLGKHLLLFLETKAKSIGVLKMGVLSPIELIDFFRKCGYRPSGDGEIEDGKVYLSKTIAYKKTKRAWRS